MRGVGSRGAVAIALVALLVGCGSAGQKQATTGAGPFQRVSFTSAQFQLVGYSWVPIRLGGASPARFPAVVWNHGSEPSVLANEGTALASFYNDAGFVFFMPIRRGHQPSPGPYRTNASMFLAEADDVAAHRVGRLDCYQITLGVGMARDKIGDATAEKWVDERSSRPSVVANAGVERAGKVVHQPRNNQFLVGSVHGEKIGRLQQVRQRGHNVIAGHVLERTEDRD